LDFRLYSCNLFIGIDTVCFLLSQCSIQLIDLISQPLISLCLGLELRTSALLFIKSSPPGFGIIKSLFYFGFLFFPLVVLGEDLGELCLLIRNVFLDGSELLLVLATCLL
jgi:hypothetical protein